MEHKTIQVNVGTVVSVDGSVVDMRFAEHLPPISTLLPANFISITDGQIYLSPSLFELGVLPDVDVGKSVSRVGAKAQRAAYREVAGGLKLAYAQFEEFETFARFGARLDEDTRRIIEHGRRIRACLKQPEFSPVSIPAQAAARRLRAHLSVNFFLYRSSGPVPNHWQVRMPAAWQQCNALKKY